MGWCSWLRCGFYGTTLTMQLKKINTNNGRTENKQTNKQKSLTSLSHTGNTWLPVNNQWDIPAPPLLVEMWMWNSSLRETVTDKSETSVTAQQHVDCSRLLNSPLASWDPNSWWVVDPRCATCFLVGFSQCNVGVAEPNVLVHYIEKSK